MPRMPRKYSQSNFYHIIVQGINKEYIFNTELNMKKYQKLIKKKLENSNIVILAYCIMNNHAHFLIYSENVSNLSKYMQRLNTSYSRLYNKENNRVGYVFRDRFRSQNILSDSQLYNCLIYIHNNPVKAGIVKDISEYKYSSYNEFLKKKIIITHHSVKLLFGDIKNYKQHFKIIHNNSANENFIDVNDKIKNITDFIKEFEIKHNQKIEEIINNKYWLKKIIIDAREQTKITIEDLAKILNVSKSKVGRYAKKM